MVRCGIENKHMEERRVARCREEGYPGFYLILQFHVSAISSDNCNGNANGIANTTTIPPTGTLVCVHVCTCVPV